MPRVFAIVACWLGIFWLLPCPAPACSLCPGGLLQQKTLREQWDKALLVVVGTLANPRFVDPKGGLGVTDLIIEQVLKSDPILGNARVIELNKYLPILDPKKPSRQVVFCDVIRERIEPSLGKEVRSPALLQYLKDSQGLQGKSRTDMLRFYFQYLDHPDPVLADDALLEFFRSTDAEVGQAAKLLPGDKLRRWLQDPKTTSDRLSLYSFLLSAAGNPDDAQLFRDLMSRQDRRITEALDGILAGYINLNPKDGWDLAGKILTDRRNSLLQRFAVVRTFRFFYGWKPQECKTDVVRGLARLIDDPAMIDIPVDEFRRWKVWDYTAKILNSFGVPGADAPIVRRSIIRYALCCPLPEARQFIDRVRRQDPETVQDLEEGLQLERKN